MGQFAFAVVAMLGYLLGGIPSGLLVGRCLGVDLRRQGSGNIGATNTARVMGLGPGLVVLVADVGKGAVAALLGSYLAGPGWGEAAAACGAVLGHAFSPYLKGRGGKSVAATLGSLLVMAPWLALVALVLFGLLVVVSRVVSVGSLGATASTTVLGMTGAATGVISAPVAAFMVLACALIFVRHRSNIERLLQGQEPRFRARG